MRFSKLSFPLLCLATFLIYRFTTPYMAVASFSYFLLLSGIFFSVSRKRHIILMGSGTVIDISLVLFLEFTRSAIAEAFSQNLGGLQRAHILFSCFAVLLYLPTMYFGWRAYRNPEKKGRIHVPLGVTAFCFRSLGFIFMFSMLAKLNAKT